MASQDKQTVYTGALLILKINGVPVGRAQSADARRSYGTEGVYELGSIMPQEHVQNRYEGTLSIERYLMRTSSLEKAGVIGLGEDILTKDIIDMEVIDKVTGESVEVYRGCTFSDHSVSVRANTITGENATVMYLSCDSGK